MRSSLLPLYVESYYVSVGSRAGIAVSETDVSGVDGVINDIAIIDVSSS